MSIEKKVSDLGLKVCGIVKSIGLKKIDGNGQEKQSALLAIGDSLLRVMMAPDSTLQVNEFVEWPIRLSVFADKKNEGNIVMLAYRQ